ncbi:MAG: oligosaccharide flippase family protein [Candidatus Ozemobacteraceae bacterium]
MLGHTNHVKQRGTNPLMAGPAEQSKVAKTLYLSFGSVLGTVISLFSLVVFSRFLSKEDYATYQQTLLIYNLFTPVVTFGAANILTIFIPADKENRSFALLLENFLILGISGLLFSSFLFFGGSNALASFFNNFRLAEILLIFSPIPFFVYPSLVASDCFLVLGKTKILALVNIFSKGIVGFSTILICIMGYGLNSIMVGYSAGQSFVSILVVGLLLFYIPKDSPRIRLNSMRSMLQLSVPMGLSTMISSVSGSMDKFLVAKFSSPQEFAIFSNGSFEIPLIGIVTGSISLVILPEMRRLIVQNRILDALECFKSAAVHSGIIIIPSMFFLWFNAESIITTVFSSSYLESTIIFQYYLLAMPARIVNFAFFFLALGQTNIVLIRSLIGLILNFLLSTILISYYGPKGAAIASLLVIYCWNTLFSLNELSKIVNIRIADIVPFKKIAQLFGISLASMGLVTIIERIFFLKLPIMLFLTFKFLFFFSVCITLTYNLKIVNFDFFRKLVIGHQVSHTEV